MLPAGELHACGRLLRHFPSMSKLNLNVTWLLWLLHMAGESVVSCDLTTGRMWDYKRDLWHYREKNKCICSRIEERIASGKDPLPELTSLFKTLLKKNKRN